MDGVFEGSAHLERELTAEPIAGPAAGSFALHLGIAGAVLLYAWTLGLFHHNVWGNSGIGGAMQVSLVSNALPLPAEEVNKNVLATEKPSKAPAPPAPKQEQKVDPMAVPILGKQVKPDQQTAQKTPLHQPPPQAQNQAQFGEQSGSSMPRSITQTGSNGPASVGDNGFANLFAYYVEGINRKMNQTWEKSEVDPRTPKGMRVYLTFTIHRDGTVSNLRLDRSSGSPTLDVSCQRGVQRVDTFGTLPQQYNQSTLQVSYYCEY
jgi:protein TonB